MTDELKPVRCGCGGEAIIGLKEWEDRKGNYHENTFVYCANCSVLTMGFLTEAEAIEAWNTAMGGKCAIRGGMMENPNRSIFDVVTELESAKYSDVDLDDAIYYLREYAEKKAELEEAIQKEKIEFLKAAEVVRICMENLNGYSNYASAYNAIPRTVKVTDYAENVSSIDVEVGGKCECGNWVYDELPYCPHCGKRLDWGEHNG